MGSTGVVIFVHIAEDWLIWQILIVNFISYLLALGMDVSLHTHRTHIDHMGSMCYDCVENDVNDDGAT